MKIATRIALIGIVTSAVGIGSVRVTAASDFCIFDGETVVGRNFSPPGAGKCKQWLGYEVTGEGGPNSSTGSGCTSADGSHVTITVTTLYPRGTSRTRWLSFRCRSVPRRA
jgi:hypothetical protein